VRPGHQLDGLLAAELRSVEVERHREPEAALLDRADSHARRDARAAQIAPCREPQHRALEAGRIADREQLLGVRPRPAATAHLLRNVEVDLEPSLVRP
jgi:hypothetical protein